MAGVLHITKDVTPSIVIPIHNSVEFLEFFPDELPSDFNDLADVLKAVFAPLNTWRLSAVEYYRQGFYHEFEYILKEIVDAILEESVEEFYRSKPNFKESLVQIYCALAAFALVKFWQQMDGLSTSSISSKPEFTFDCDATDASISDQQIKEIQKSNSTTAQRYAQLVVSYVERADAVDPVNEYTWLIKGFFEIRQGYDISRAEKHFLSILERRGDIRSVKSNGDDKFVYAANLGLAVIAYNEKKYQLALERFVKSISANPTCPAGVYVATGVCLYHLSIYDAARWACEMALNADPCNCNGLVLLGLLENVRAVCDQNSASHGVVGKSNAFNLMNLVQTIGSTDRSHVMQNTIARGNASLQMGNLLIDNWVSVISGKSTKGVDYCYADVTLRSEFEITEEDSGKYSLSDIVFVVEEASDVFKSLRAVTQGDPILIGKFSTLVKSVTVGTQDNAMAIQINLVESPASDTIESWIPAGEDTSNGIRVAFYGAREGDVAVKAKICVRHFFKAQQCLSNAIRSVVPVVSSGSTPNSLYGLHSDCYYLLGRIAHEQRDIPEALRLYSLSTTCAIPANAKNLSETQRLANVNVLALYQLGVLVFGSAISSLSTVSGSDHDYVLLGGSIACNITSAKRALKHFQDVSAILSSQSQTVVPSGLDSTHAAVEDASTQAYIVLISAILMYNAFRTSPVGAADRLKSSEYPHGLVSFERLFELMNDCHNHNKIGFVYEELLYSLQGQLRMCEYSINSGAVTEKSLNIALKCFDKACQVRLHNATSLDASVVMNIGSIHFMLGNSKKAYDYVRKSLQLVAADADDQKASLQAVFKSPQNDVFYELSNVFGTGAMSANVFVSHDPSIAVSDEDDVVLKLECMLAESGDDSMSSRMLTSDEILVGDDIIIEGVLCSVKSVVTSMDGAGGGSAGDSFESDMYADIVNDSAPKEFVSHIVVSSPVLLSLCPDLSFGLPIERKVMLSNFNADTVNICYNLALINIDLGNILAGLEILNAIITHFPTYFECYLICGKVYESLGQYKSAIECVQKGIQLLKSTVQENTEGKVSAGHIKRLYKHNAGIMQQLHTLLADLYAGTGQLELAKKDYEYLCGSDAQDIRSLTSLGNLYFQSLVVSSRNMTVAASASYEQQIKDSYKFFHNALTLSASGNANTASKAVNNIYAACGLSMVCAERKLWDASRTMFSRLRESNLSSLKPNSLNYQMSEQNICANLGHISLVQAIDALPQNSTALSPTQAAKFTDAIYMYQAALRAVLSVNSKPTVTDKKDKAPAVVHPHPLESNRIVSSVVSLCECLAIAHLRSYQHDSAVRFMCKAMWYEPPGPGHSSAHTGAEGAEAVASASGIVSFAYASNFQALFNTAYVLEEAALHLLVKKSGSDGSSFKSVSEVESALRGLHLAHRLFSSLSTAGHPGGSTSLFSRYVCNGAHARRLPLEGKQASAHASFCADNIEKASTVLLKAQVEEQKARENKALLDQEAHDKLQLKLRRAEEEKALIEESKRLTQEKAALKLARLEKLQETWTAASSATATKKASSKKRSTASAEHDSDSDAGGVYDSDEDASRPAKKVDSAAELEAQQRARDIKNKERELAQTESATEDEDEFDVTDDSDSDGSVDGLHDNDEPEGDEKVREKRKRKDGEKRKKKKKKSKHSKDESTGVSSTADNSREPGQATPASGRLMKKAANDVDDLFGDDDEEESGAQGGSESAATEVGTSQNRRTVIDDDE